MRLKLLFGLGIATGYVLGARAGRPAYETIKAKASKTWEDPRVQKVVSDAEDFVKEATPVVEARLSEATTAAASGVRVATRKVSEAAEVTADNAKVAAEKVADAAVSLKERLQDAVDTVAQKVGTHKVDSSSPADRTPRADEEIVDAVVVDEVVVDEVVVTEAEPKPLP
jgi:hypothetical protein